MTGPLSPPDQVRRALKADLSEHDGCWFEVQCSGCRTTTHHPARLLIQRLGPRHRLIDIIPRLSCKACKAKPATVYLCETPYRTTSKGPSPGWSLQLFPPGWADDPSAGLSAAAPDQCEAAE